MRFPTLLFDLDGTLLDSRRLAVEAASLPLTRLRLPVPDEDHILGLIGLPEEEYYRGLLPPGAPAEQVELLRRAEVEQLEREAPLFPGLLDGLSQLEGRRLGLVTNAGRAYMETALATSGLDRLFHVAFCCDDGADKVGLVEMALRELRKPAAMIGDREADWRAGKAHGLYTVACRWGFGTPEELAGADLQLGTPAELVSFLSDSCART